MTPIVALVPPTPSTEAQATESCSKGASKFQAKSREQEPPVSESGKSVQKVTINFPELCSVSCSTSGSSSYCSEILLHAVGVTNF